MQTQTHTPIGTHTQTHRHKNTHARIYIYTYRPPVQCFVQHPAWPLLQFSMLCSCLTHTQANSCSRAALPALLAMTWSPATHSYCSSLRFFPAVPLLMQHMSSSLLFGAQAKILWPCSQGVVLSWPQQPSGSQAPREFPPTLLGLEVPKAGTVSCSPFISNPEHQVVPQMVAGEQGPGLRRGQGPWARAGRPAASEPTWAGLPQGAQLCPSPLSLTLKGSRTAPLTVPFLKYQPGSCLPRTHEAPPLHNTTHVLYFPYIIQPISSQAGLQRPCAGSSHLSE